ncbi:MAG: LLM class flavin-dependent oxidoreductase [Acidimicrobiia bacterium]
MKVSLFVELSVPKPWDASSEAQCILDNLATVELADQVGFHGVWITEHHFLEEYAHASAPEVFLAALARTTKRIRLGHAVIQSIPLVNHPARIAERIGMLDVISGGRVELGTGEGSSVAELAGFNVDPGRKRDMWREGTKTAIRCMSETPFRGVEGEYISMPPRNVVPKPLQKPHPPLWVACTRDSTIDLASSHAIGALSFSLAGPEQASERVTRYYDGLESAIPFAASPNPNILFLGGNLVCAPTKDDAMNRIGWNSGFFGHGVAHYYTGPMHSPGRENLWQEYLDSATGRTQPLARDGSPLGGDRDDWERLAKAAKEAQLRDSAVGDVDQIRRWIERFEAAGADEIMFMLGAWNLEHDLETVEKVGTLILPAVIERDEQHVADKQRRLAPLLERIEARRVDDVSPYPDDFRFGGVPVSWTDQKVHDEIGASMREASALIQQKIDSPAQ